MDNYPLCGSQEKTDPYVDLLTHLDHNPHSVNQSPGLLTKVNGFVAVGGYQSLWAGLGRWKSLTVDGCEIHFAPPKKPWNDSIPLEIPTNNGFPWLQSGVGFRPSTV